MKKRSADESASSTASEAMRAALDRQLGDPSASAGFETPPVIPDHKLLRRIGRGAYGDVWLARSALGTLRAVKVIYRAQFEDDHPYEREFNGILKYEPISRSHEGLVHVLHVGRNEAAGCFYYVMEVADNVNAEENQAERGTAVSKEGQGPVPSSPASSSPDGASYRPRTLRSDLSRHQRLPPMEAAQLALRLAVALGHLHRNGLVHRDVKPSNVIFVGSQPKLADIGLVTGAGDSRSFVGTEGFVPPEGPGTPQADLYGLGKLLYELATGRDRMEFPQLVSDVAQRPEGEALLELNEVIIRACEPEAANRYATATEMHADLNLFLSGRSLRATRRMERNVVWLKRFAYAAGMCLVLAAGVVWFAGMEEHRAREREQAASERARVEAGLRKRAEEAERVARNQLYSAYLGEARAVMRAGEMGQRTRALDALRLAAAISNTAELRREVFVALALPDVRFQRELAISPGMTLAQLDPNFERWAICRGRGPVRILAVSDNRELATLPASTNLAVHTGTWSADGKYFAVKRELDSAGLLAEWEIWDVSIPRLELLLHRVSSGAISFHPHLPQVMAASGGEAVLWDLTSGQELRRFNLAPERITLLRFAPDGNRFAAVRDTTPDQTIAVYDAATGNALVAYAQFEHLGDVNWHPDGKWLAVADYSGAVSLLDSRTNNVHTLGQHKAQAVRSVFSPDGRYLISGGWERELICWDMEKMSRVFNMNVDSYLPQFRADGREVAAGTGLKLQARVYAFERPSGFREFSEDLGTIQEPPKFSPDGRWMAALGQRRVGIWNLARPGPGTTAEPGGHGRLFFSADSTELFASIREDDCARWRVVPRADAAAAPGLQRLPLSKPNGFISLCLVSNLLVWTTTNGTRITALDEADSNPPVWSRTSRGMSWISPNARWLGIYQSFGAVFSLFQWPGLKPAASLTNKGSIRNFAFSPKGDEVAIASPERVEFWSTTTWQRTRELTNFMGVLYSPEGNALWLTRDYRNAGLFDAANLRELLPLPEGTLPLTMSPDGRSLAVSVDLRRIQVWDLADLRERLRELGLDWGASANP